MISNRADQITIRTTTEADGLLVLSEISYPAWKAYVDVQPVHTYVADEALRAVAVPSGEHLVELRFESAALTAGIVISAAAALVLAGTWLAGGQRAVGRNDPRTKPKRRGLLCERSSSASHRVAVNVRITPQMPQQMYVYLHGRGPAPLRHAYNRCTHPVVTLATRPNPAGVISPPDDLSTGSLQWLACIRLDPSDRIPLHAQLATAMRTLIRSEQLAVGTTLPGEFELAAALGVSRHTVRHAIGVLVNEGSLRRQRGAKTVVASGPPLDSLIERRLGSFYAFAWEVEARGGEHRSRLLARSTMGADARIAQLLDVPLGSRVERIERLRLAADEPLVLEVAVVPAPLAAGFEAADLERESIYDLLERLHGIVVSRAQESLRPVVLDRRSAGLLSVADESAAFAVERVSWTPQRPIEWQQSLIRGDRYLYSVDLPRAKKN